MRRWHTYRIRSLLAIILIFCIYWYIFNETNSTKRDQAEEQAYLYAVGASLPMIHNPQLCSSN
jgi:hypothetical protein